jgi:acetyltransferase-like isoleucine patch superfamily enzyme
MLNSFYSEEELAQIGLNKYGNHVLISRKASIYSPQNISIGNNVRIDDFCILSGDIKIESYVHISAYSALYGKFGIIMEDYTGLSPRCTLFSASDDFSGDYLISPMVPEKYTHITGGSIILKRFTQVGAGSIILPDVTLHEGVAIGAMSLVKKNLDAWSIYAGNPLRFIKQRKKGLLNYYGKF